LINKKFTQPICIPSGDGREAKEAEGDLGPSHLNVREGRARAVGGPQEALDELSGLIPFPFVTGDLAFLM
jgi:hypothetical protein